jgi:hypothetical protein
MGVPSSDQQGGELLVQEIREEASRLVHHPFDEMRRLEHVAEEGDSATTPLILAVAVAAVVAVIVAAVVAVALGFYYTG